MNAKVDEGVEASKGGGKGEKAIGKKKRTKMDITKKVVVRPENQMVSGKIHAEFS